MKKHKPFYGVWILSKENKNTSQRWSIGCGGWFDSFFASLREAKKQAEEVQKLGMRARIVTIKITSMRRFFADKWHMTGADPFWMAASIGAE